MEQSKVFAAALALREFSVEELSALSGVNINTVRTALRRNEMYFDRSSREADRKAVSGQRGRPEGRWAVTDGEGLRTLLDKSVALPYIEPQYPNIELDELHSIAVSVAEDALAATSAEPNEMLRRRMFDSARSSLFFSDSENDLSEDPYWWDSEASEPAIRARGVNSLATFANLLTENGQPTGQELFGTAEDIAAAMRAAPDHAEATYFAPFVDLLASSGRFAPMLYLMSPSEDEPLSPFVDNWTEVNDIHMGFGRVLTQTWARPLAHVAISMPLVVPPGGNNDDVVPLLDILRRWRRPAVVFGRTNELLLMKRSAMIGATFVPTDDGMDSQQDAMDSLAGIIQRSSFGR